MKNLYARFVLFLIRPALALANRLYVEVMLFLWALVHAMLEPVRREATRRGEATPEYRAWYDANLRPLTQNTEWQALVSRGIAQLESEEASSGAQSSPV